MWANTYMVGCGYTYYNDDKRGYSKLYVCNYGPGGNLVGGSLVSQTSSEAPLTPHCPRSTTWASPG